MCVLGCGWRQTGVWLDLEAELDYAKLLPLALQWASSLISSIECHIHAKSFVIVCDFDNTPIFHLYGPLWSSSLYWHAFWFLKYRSFSNFLSIRLCSNGQKNDVLYLSSIAWPRWIVRLTVQLDNQRWRQPWWDVFSLYLYHIGHLNVHFKCSYTLDNIAALIRSPIYALHGLAVRAM